MNLRLDWCGHDAAKYACEKWHYSGCLPAGKLVKIGVWEDKKYIGVVIFSYGANKNAGEPYGLNQTEVCELTRVALTKHRTEVSKIISIALKLLQKQSPGIKLVVSYADSEQGHTGSIYQAGNWVFCGVSTTQINIVKGERLHPRTIRCRYGTNSMDWIQKHIDPKARRQPGKKKFRYLYPLTPEMKRNIEILRQPYPKKKSVNSVSDNTSSFHEEEGGSNPTLTHGDK